MKIYRSVTWDVETGDVLEEDSFEYVGPLALCDRAATGQAQSAATTAGNTAAGEGAGASSIGSTLQPFLTQQMLHPQGYSQQDLTQQLNASEAGAGGASSAVTGDAALMAARSRNPSGFTTNLDNAARSRDKASAGASEQVAANDADVKQQQQQSGAKGLSGMYGTDTDAMLKSMGLQTGDINAETSAQGSGWLQNMTGIISALGTAAGGAGKLMSGINS